MSALKDAKVFKLQRRDQLQAFAQWVDIDPDQRFSHTDLIARLDSMPSTEFDCFEYRGFAPDFDGATVDLDAPDFDDEPKFTHTWTLLRPGENLPVTGWPLLVWSLSLPAHLFAMRTPRSRRAA